MFNVDWFPNFIVLTEVRECCQMFSLFAVSYTHLDVYKRQADNTAPISTEHQLAESLNYNEVIKDKGQGQCKSQTSIF